MAFFMLAECHPNCQPPLLWIWHTKLCNQINESTTSVPITAETEIVHQWSHLVTYELKSVGTFHFWAVNAIKQQDQTLWYYCAAPYAFKIVEWTTVSNS